MKRLYVLIIVPLLALSPLAYISYQKYVEAQKDHEAPVIKVLEDDLRFFASDDINYLDYIEVSDNSNEFEINIINEEYSKLPGKRCVEIEAIDKEGNSAFANINVNIIDDEEWENFIVENTYNYKYRRSENSDFLKEKGHADYDAFNLALEFIGMRGGCNEVAQAFINAYFGEGYDVLLGTHAVTKEEARPGDIIYYTNGGEGLQHYAVYLGGTSALQGNINGTTVIGSVYMNNGSAPQFRRLNGLD